MEDYIYDVALSFAGEDRDYVRKVADSLRANGIRVFYDEFERSTLWGKELIDYLEDIYSNKSNYVIIFISKSYLTKDWTNHERKSSLNRALKNKEEYILPVRLDESKLSGLHESIGYISAESLFPIDICHLFLEKIGKKIMSTLQPPMLLYRLSRKKYAKDISGKGGIHGTRWTSVGTKLLHMYGSTSSSLLEILVHVKPIFLRNDFCIVQFTMPADTIVTTIYESDLPKGWRRSYDFESTRKIGDNWIEKNETCILSVPSTVLPNERQYLLNPNNKKFDDLRISKVQDFEIDPRLNQ